MIFGGLWRVGWVTSGLLGLALLPAAASSRPNREQRARLVLLLGALEVAMGIGLTGSVGGQGQPWGGLVLVLGWLTLVVGIHRFGRLGAP